LIILAKNNKKRCAGKGIDHGKGVGTQLNTAGVSYTLLAWLDCAWNMMAHAQKPDFLFRQMDESI